MKRKQFVSDDFHDFLSGGVKAEVAPPNDLLAELTVTKEPIVRLTVDLPKSMHEELSRISYETGRKKSEIVRYLLAQFFDKWK